MVWYCDTSALVKRYLKEPGSIWFRSQCGRQQLLTSTLTIAEIAAAFGRRQRQGALLKFEVYHSRNQFRKHLETTQYSFLPSTDEIIQHAAQLIGRQPLAAYDAVHLASAVDYLKTVGLNSKQFYFITADVQLQRAAESEGLQTENPNDHP